MAAQRKQKLRVKRDRTIQKRGHGELIQYPSCIENESFQVQRLS